MTLEQLKAALLEAFDAGFDQGNDEAVAYDWGCLPNQDRESAFNELFEEWNTGPIQDVIKMIKEQNESTD